jgi:hypothetical protein
MAPLALWAMAVVVLFGVSFKELENLQGPLSSLNVAGEVQPGRRAQGSSQGQGQKHPTDWTALNRA